MYNIKNTNSEKKFTEVTLNRINYLNLRRESQLLTLTVEVSIQKWNVL